MGSGYMVIKEGGKIVTTENLDIRMLVSEMNLSFKSIAEKLGVTPEYLSRCMRYPLKPDMRARIMNAVTDLKGEQDDAI